MNTTKEFHSFERQLMDEDIIVRAHQIAEASKEIERIEEEKKRIKPLREKIADLSVEIERGCIRKYLLAELQFHCPSESLVTITPVDNNDFPPIVREMTSQEISEHSQIELEFEANPEVAEETPEGQAPEGVDLNPWLNSYKEHEAKAKDMLVEEVQEYDSVVDNKIDVYKSVKSERFFILNDVGERVYLAVVSADAPMSNLIVFIHPIAATGYLRKLKDEIILVNQKKGEEHLLNSTGNYDLVENPDGSVSSKLKSEEAA